MNIAKFFKLQKIKKSGLGSMINLNSSKHTTGKIISSGQRINPKRQEKKKFCRKHGITGKQYRKYQKKSRRDSVEAEKYLERVSKKWNDPSTRERL